MTSHTYFGSNMTEPLNLLSNFSECKIYVRIESVPPAVLAIFPKLKDFLGDDELVFASSEHLWQAMRISVRIAASRRRT